MALAGLKRKASFENDVPDKRLNPASVEVNDDDEERVAKPPAESIAVHGTRKLPTTEELSAIHASTSLYRSTQFHALLVSLLADVAPEESTIAPLEHCLHELHSYLTSIPPFPPTHPLDAANKLQKKGVHVPWSNPIPQPEVQYKVAFEPPTPDAIYIVGSYAGKNKTLVRSREGNFCLDLAVDMPSSLIQEKDYLNSRILHKRSFYLAFIASSLSSFKSPFKSKLNIQYECLNGDSRRPCLLLSPLKDTFSSAFSIRLIPCIPATSPIPPHRLSPTHSSLRSGSVAHVPTPNYSATLSLLTLARTHLLQQYYFSTQIPSFNDALRLLKIWANQWGYCRSPSGHGVYGFEGRSSLWGCLIAAVVLGEDPLNPKSKDRKNKPIVQLGRGLSSYQLMRAALELLVTRDFVKNKLLMKPLSESHQPPFPPEHWLEYNGPVLVDPSGKYNLLEGIAPEALILLARDAKSTLATLNVAKSQSPTAGEDEDDIFQETFATDLREPLGRFDAYLEFDLSRVKLPEGSSHNDDQDSGSHRSDFLSRILKILARGLTNRIRTVVLLTTSNPPQPISTPFSVPVEGKVGIGIIFNPSEAYRLVDHGPAPTPQDDVQESEELKDFRFLWGSKAELRRFKDGAIHESVVWELPSGIKAHTAREQIPSRIVRYLLQLHFGIAPGEVYVGMGALDDVLCFDSDTERHLGTTASVHWSAAQRSFDNLVKLLNTISSSSEVPLALSSVQPSSPYLRQTSVFPAIPIITFSSSFHTWSEIAPSSLRHIPASDIILHFEKSTSWPDDVSAIQSVKLALLEALARGLLSKADWNGVAHVIAGDMQRGELEDWSGYDKAVLEIITPEGFAFHARIYHDREAVLLRRIISPPKITNPLSNPPSTPKEQHLATHALHLHIRRYIQSPQHHSALLTLHHRFPSLSHTIRLAKRFFNAHLLGGSLDEIVIELLVCASFFQRMTTHLTDNITSSGTRGFVLFIRWLAEWDWTKGADIPLYTLAKDEDDLNPVSTSIDVPSSSDIITRGATYHLRTDRDPQGTVFTATSLAPGPSPVLARRITTIAIACYKAISESKGVSHKTLFAHPLSDYDFLIHLKPRSLPRYAQNIARIISPSTLDSSSKYRNLALGSGNAEEDVTRVDFDPGMLYYTDLKKIYATSETAELLFDTLGGTIIGGVWNPTLKEERRWRVMSGYSTLPQTGAGSTSQQNKHPKKDRSNEMVVLNQQAVLAEMARMGEGIVKRVEVVDHGMGSGGPEVDAEVEVEDGKARREEGDGMEIEEWGGIDVDGVGIRNGEGDDEDGGRDDSEGADSDD